MISFLMYMMIIVAVVSIDLKVVVVSITSAKSTDPRLLLGWSFRVGESVNCCVLY